MKKILVIIVVIIISSSFIFLFYYNNSPKIIVSSLVGKTNQQDITINKKTYRIVLVKAEIKRRDKNPYHKSNISMVLLREKENIPILIKVFASGILINAKLIDIR